MKIGIDCRMMGKGFGIARYIEQLVLHLRTIDTVNTYRLFVRNDEQKALLVAGGWGENDITTVDIPWYSFEEQTKLPKVIGEYALDLVHFPHWNVPMRYQGRFVVTIHDLIMFHYPRPEATTLGPLKFWAKDMAHRLVIRQAVKRSTHILTTSSFTAHDLNQTLGVPLGKMTVTYQAPFVEKSKFKTQSSKLVLEKYGIAKPYVLYVGAAYPHKNLEGLLRAWEVFERKYGGEYQLVLAGKEDYFWRRLKESVDKMIFLNHPIFTGFVSDDELASLYGQARLYVFPSLYEGFGLPPLEAMAHGVPVASSNRTCLPEILGEAALYMDPENDQQMADVMYQGLCNEDVRFTLRTQAREELRRYSWEVLARQTVRVYENFSSV